MGGGGRGGGCGGGHFNDSKKKRNEELLRCATEKGKELEKYPVYAKRRKLQKEENCKRVNCKHSDKGERKRRSGGKYPFNANKGKHFALR